MFKYRLTIPQVNELDSEILKLLYKKRYVQVLRNDIMKLLHIDDPEQLPSNWLVNIQMNYKTRRE